MNLSPEQRKKALAWAAEGLSYREINTKAGAEDPPWGVTYKWLQTQRQKQAKKYVDIREAYEREMMEEGLARKAVRLYRKMERAGLLDQIIRERGEDETMSDVPGGKTGLIVRDFKGEKLVPVYKVDAALLKEIRDLEREIAIELGQWTEKKEVSGPEGGPIPVAVTDLVTKIYGDEQEEESTAENGDGTTVR